MDGSSSLAMLTLGMMRDDPMKLLVNDKSTRARFDCYGQEESRNNGISNTNI
jgi:hypothetical protein